MFVAEGQKSLRHSAQTARGECVKGCPRDQQGGGGCMPLVTTAAAAASVSPRAHPPKAALAV